MEHLKPVIRSTGAAVLMSGLAVASGRLLRMPLAVQLQPDSTAMVFATALCFVLAGLALLAPVHAPRAGRYGRRAVNIALAEIVMPPLLATLSGATSPWDFPGLHGWLNDGNPRQGRTAPNTAIAFLLAGAMFWFVSSPNVRAPFASRVVLVLLVMVVGTGLLSFWLRTPIIFNGSCTRMAFPMALGLLVLGIGLWNLATRRMSVHPPERAITRTAAYTMMVGVPVAGFAVFVA